MTFTVIHGAPETGKTRFAERFRKHYGCSRIFEEWDPEGRTRQRADPRPGDLVLTQLSAERIRHQLGPGPRIVSIADALRAIGVGSAT